MSTRSSHVSRLLLFALLCSCLTAYSLASGQAFVPSPHFYSGVPAHNYYASASSPHNAPLAAQNMWSAAAVGAGAAMEGAAPAVFSAHPHPPAGAGVASTSSSSSAKPATRIVRVFVSAADEQFATTALTQIVLTINVERLVKAAQSSTPASTTAAGPIPPSVGVDMNPYAGVEHEEGVTMSAPSRGPQLSNVELEVALKKASVEAQTELVQRVNEVIKLLNRAHVERLRTTSVGLEPMFEYPQYGPARQVGMRAKNSLNFRVNTTTAGALLSALIDAGVTQIDGISHVATDEEIQRVMLIAITNAVHKASERGKLALLESAADCKDDIEIKEVVLRTPDGGSPSNKFDNEYVHPQMAPMALASAVGGAGVGGDLTIVGGENKIAVKANLAMECRIPQSN